ncbi:hypothetical protein DL93DRAFT_1363981 [Clavulina sp. PMI_390]|nr:hypothetical protein DL93DRAFT_1363981 [Clavulina sp. PMI_390]
MIHTLPHELLRDIFRFAALPSQQSAVLRLTHVSNRWRNVACECPWLFTEAIWDRWPNELIELWCSRASQSLLTVRMTSWASVHKLLGGVPRSFAPFSGFPSSTPVDETLAKYVSILMHTRPNWGFLCIDFTSLKRPLDTGDRLEFQNILLRDGLPRGRELTYKYQDPWERIIALEDTLPVFEAPELQSVDLTGATLDPRTFCPSLTRLAVGLSGRIGPDPFPSSIMRGFFSREPGDGEGVALGNNIQYLTIIPFKIQWASAGLNLLSLPSVQSFAIALTKTQAPRWLPNILSLLDFPNAKIFKLHCHFLEFGRVDFRSEFRAISLRAPQIRTLRVTFRASLPQGTISILGMISDPYIFPELRNVELDVDQEFIPFIDGHNVESLWPRRMAERVENELIALVKRREIARLVIPVLSKHCSTTLEINHGVDVLVSSILPADQEPSSLMLENSDGDHPKAEGDAELDNYISSHRRVLVIPECQAQ